MTIWWLMLFGGAVTFCIRYSFIAAQGHYQPPGWFRRLLPFIPVAALTALTAPELLLMQGEVVLGAGNPRLWAGIAAILVAALWRNVLLTIACGFTALFILQGV